jgi:histidine triad (HIT) family protein
MSECIFCKIIAGEIPATVIHEDADSLVFMDIGPIIKGHALVVSKKHYDPITRTPDEILAGMHVTAKRIAQAQMNALGADGVNIMQNNGKAAGQEVEHIHIHVIPRFADDGHRWNWNARKYDSMEEMNELAGRIRNNLK